MAEPASLTAGGAFVAGLGIVSNIASAVQGIQAATALVSAQEGLKYSLYAFKLKVDEKVEASASLKTETLASPIQSRLFLTIKFAELGNQAMNSAYANFSVTFVSIGGQHCGYVSLGAYKGFDTAIGSQLSVDFTGLDCDEGHLLVYRGFVNGFGASFAHFSGSCLIRWSLKPIAKSGVIVPSNQGSWSQDSNSFDFR